MSKDKSNTQHAAILGGEFSQVALAAALYRYANHPIEIRLFEKSGQFGAGEAYRIPYVWHLLNAWCYLGMCCWPQRRQQYKELAQHMLG